MRCKSLSSSLRMTPFSQNQIVTVLVWLSAAEVPASEAASASSYDLSKYIRILAVIVAELKLGHGGGVKNRSKGASRPNRTIAPAR